MMNIKKGFTLTEVLIVVVVLAILAALVLPRFFNQDERGVVAEAVANLSAIRQAEASYYLENSLYTSDLNLLDVDVLSSTKFVYAIDATTGAATATRKGERIGDCRLTGPEPFSGCTIILNMDGTWDPAASHPYKPS